MADIPGYAEVDMSLDNMTLYCWAYNAEGAKRIAKAALAEQGTVKLIKDMTANYVGTLRPGSYEYTGDLASGVTDVAGQSLYRWAIPLKPAAVSKVKVVTSRREDGSLKLSFA